MAVHEPRLLQLDSVFVIDPTSDVRARLFQALSLENRIAKLGGVRFLPDGLVSLVNEDRRTDIVFISNKFPEDAVYRFINAAKRTRSGAGATFILLLEDAEAGPLEVQRRVEAGLDGFLVHPFTTQNVNRILELALTLHRQRAKNAAPPESQDVVLRDCIDTPELPASPPMEEQDIEKVRAELEEEDWHRRLHALERAVSLGVQAAPLMSQISMCLTDKRATCRIKARSALLAIGTEKAKELLQKYLGEHHFPLSADVADAELQVLDEIAANDSLKPR
jgi:hypothetical protein